MRKSHLRLLVAAVLGSSLIASGSVMAKTKITWWVGSEYSWKQMHDLFEKQNPNIDIVMVHGDIDKFYTMITAGMMPDIWGPWSTPGIHADVNRNWAIDLGPYIKRDGKEMNMDDFFPGVMRQFKIAGKQYSLPIFSYADYFFYNKQLYNQAGIALPPVDATKNHNWSWEQMVANAQKTTIKDGAGKVKQWGTNFSTGLFDFPNYFHMWGAEPYTAETLKTSVPQAVHWNTPEMVNALTKVWELRWRYGVAGGDFAGGKSASTFEHGYNIQNYMKTKKLQGQWGIAPLPWAKTNSGTLWPDGWRISRVCKNKEAAWKFVKFLCSPSSMNLIVSDPKSSKPGSPVVRKSVFKETLGRDVGKMTGMAAEDVFLVHEQADDVGIVKYQETVCLHADLEKYLNPELEKIWTNKVDPKTGAANLQRVADKALPVLFNRWLRNIKFTGAEKSYKK